MGRPYPIARCDVLDKKSLKEFRRKRLNWLRWFDRDSIHSVSTQLNKMLTEHAVFRILFRRSLELAQLHEQDTAVYNFYLYNFFESSWLRLQVLHIRKLTESGEYKDGRKKKQEMQVISLRRIAEDIRDNWKLFTRENFVSYDGVPFDWHESQSKYSQRYPRNGKAQWQPLRGQLAWVRSYSDHRKFDEIAGRRFANHRRKDRLPSSVIENIIKRLERNRFRDVIDVANKIVAHPADVPSRRSSRTRFNLPIMFARIEGIHKELCAIANFLSVTLISGTYFDSFLPASNFDPLEYLNRPWIAEEYIGELQAHWEHHEAVVRDYGNYNLHSLLGKPSKSK